MDSSTGDNSSVSICAACGKAGDNLKACTSCKQVKYCNRNCQKLHWPKHKKECKQLTAELRAGDNKSSDTSIISEGVGSINLSDSIPAYTTAADKKMNISYKEKQKMVHVKNDTTSLDDKLFEDPPPKEDCPICMLPMPHAKGQCGIKTTYQPCCGKRLCSGCVVAAQGEMERGNMKDWCAFCRVPQTNSNTELLKRLKQRMLQKDANAFEMLGINYYEGIMGLPKDKNKAIELWHQSAELGSINAHYNLATVYLGVEGVEEDFDKAIHHWKCAAIGGQEIARHNLGLLEQRNGNMDRAMKHWMIAARAGFDESLKEVGNGYKTGHVRKEDYATTLRAYQVSMEEMKSKQREIAMQN